jgi:hypothetical protein
VSAYYVSPRSTLSRLLVLSPLLLMVTHVSRGPSQPHFPDEKVGLKGAGFPDSTVTHTHSFICKIFQPISPKHGMPADRAIGTVWMSQALIRTESYMLISEM